MRTLPEKERTFTPLRAVRGRGWHVRYQVVALQPPPL
jgi:hypothetical protein